MKLFKTGMYGGKFMPFHKGHQYCLEKALEQCDKVFLLLFINGDDEDKIIMEHPELTPESRIGLIQDTIKQYGDRVVFRVVDVKECRYPDGTENWDAETPLVLNITGKMDAVYSSEYSYDPYFKNAYPWAKHVLVDPPREIVPISATKIRSMSTKEALKWLPSNGSSK